MPGLKEPWQLEKESDLERTLQDREVVDSSFRSFRGTVVNSAELDGCLPLNFFSLT